MTISFWILSNLPFLSYTTIWHCIVSVLKVSLNNPSKKIATGIWKNLYCYTLKFYNSSVYFLYRFEACWPALQQDTHGIIFVYNPSKEDHARDLELLYNYFVTQTGFSYKNCVLFANQKQPADKDVKHSSKLCMSTYLLFYFYLLK